MPTPRSESIKLARSDDVAAVPSHAFGDGERGKIDHYAYMARVLHKGVESLLDNPGSLDTALASRTRHGLDAYMQQTLYAHIMDAWELPEFSEMVSHLEQSQKERRRLNGNVHPTADETLLAGVCTFVDSTSGLYGALDRAFGSEAAAHPNNASILDRISKLNISQFIPYKDVYLNDGSSAEPLNTADFIKQFERDSEGSYRFKLGYPLKAVVTVASTQDKGIWGTTDFRINGNPTIILGTVPTDSATVGCPFSFDPEQGRALWSLYASTRHAIELRASLAQESLKILDDTDASHRPIQESDQPS